MEPTDVNMADLQVSRHLEDLKVETSEDDIDDVSSTDESSIDEAHYVPRGLPSRELPTGLCYDERMRYHAEVAALSAEAVHPEDPRRIYYIYQELCEAGLVKHKDYELMVNQPLLRIDAREATEEEIRLVHTAEHWNFVKDTASFTNDALVDLSESSLMDSIYFNRLSFYSGKLSAGGAIETCKAVMEQRVKNAIAVIRPPGHHAEVDQTMGFCLFNNTCVASKVCQSIYGQACRKILILDWDVHHGNGCQKAFYEDPNILYISLHVHQGGRFYPAGPEGGMDRCGKGLGEGYNVNIPWESKGMGDGDYMYAFQHVVMPIANAFNPDFVIVSAGFDAAAGDELGGCNVTPPCYAHMTHMLMSLAGGKVAVCLEGGYNFRAISRSALAVTRTLMGEPPDRLEATGATTSGVKVVEEVKRTQSRYWHCMYPKAPTGGIYGGERLHDIVRQYQAQQLFDNYKLTELFIVREKISPSFHKQVLGSIAYDQRKCLLVFFHDPPDLLSDPDAQIAQQKPHNTWMLDGSQAYIDQAVKGNLGVIDINIPEKITITADPNIDENRIYTDRNIAYSDQQTTIARQEGEKLAHYVWENYIEPNEFDGGIWLIGAGNAFHAVTKLIADNERVYQRCKGVIGFICQNPLRPVSNVANNNHFISSWYRESSRVYVAKDHRVWMQQDEGKKISKRYGQIIKSPETMLNSMMQKHLPEVFDFIRETGGFDEMDTESSTSNGDADATEPDEDDQPHLRGPSVYSPPRNRPDSAAATAQTSAALRAAISPQPGGTSPRSGYQPMSMSMSPGLFRSTSPGARPSASRSESATAVQTLPAQQGYQGSGTRLSTLDVPAPNQPTTAWGTPDESLITPVEDYELGVPHEHSKWASTRNKVNLNHCTVRTDGPRLPATQRAPNPQSAHDRALPPDSPLPHHRTPALVPADEEDPEHPSSDLKPVEEIQGQKQHNKPLGKEAQATYDRQNAQEEAYKRAAEKNDNLETFIAHELEGLGPKRKTCNSKPAYAKTWSLGNAEVSGKAMCASKGPGDAEYDNGRPHEDATASNGDGGYQKENDDKEISGRTVEQEPVTGSNAAADDGGTETGTDTRHDFQHGLGVSAQTPAAFQNPSPDITPAATLGLSLSAVAAAMMNARPTDIVLTQANTSPNSLSGRSSGILAPSPEHDLLSDTDSDPPVSQRRRRVATRRPDDVNDQGSGDEVPGNGSGPDGFTHRPRLAQARLREARRRRVIVNSDDDDE